jgi:putative addiction module component (TIGR02574 family)
MQVRTPSAWPCVAKGCARAVPRAYSPRVATERFDEMQAAALALPESDRAYLAHDLIDSIESPHDDRDDAAWSAELRSRVDDIVEGRVQTIPTPRSGRGWRLIVKHGVATG